MMRRIPLFLAVLTALTAALMFACGCDDDPKTPTIPDNAQWYTEAVDTAELTGYFTSVAVDAAGLPHIVYFDGTRDDLNYAYFDGSAWHISVIDPDVSGKGSNTFTTIRIDGTGRLHVAYTNLLTGDLLYATSSNGSVWDIAEVDTAGNVGAFPSMDLDASGAPYFCYGKTIDTVTGLYVAFLDEDSLFTRRELDTSGAVIFSSIAVDDDNVLHIVYQMDTYLSARLCYMTGSDFAWLRDTIAPPGTALGQYCSIDLGAGGVPSVTYRTQDASQKLNFATRSGDAWLTETVSEATGDQTGLFCRLAFDDDVPRIVYQDILDGGANWRLQYAVRGGGVWRIETVDSTGAAGAYPGLAIDSQNRPHISYQDYLSHDLKYAVKR